MPESVERAARFESFAAFYPFYLAEHADRTSRRLHVCGTILAFVILVAVVATGAWPWLVLVPLVGYGLAWIGHMAFEKNRPATFRHPLYSLLGDLRMAFDVVTGRIAW